MFGPRQEKELLSAHRTGLYISDKMEAAIISKCLDLTRDLKALNSSFDITFKLESTLITFKSDDEKVYKKKKSQSQQQRDYQRKQEFLRTKTDSNNTIPPESSLVKTIPSTDSL